MLSAVEFSHLDLFFSKIHHQIHDIHKSPTNTKMQLALSTIIPVSATMSGYPSVCVQGLKQHHRGPTLAYTHPKTRLAAGTHGRRRVSERGRATGAVRARLRHRTEWRLSEAGPGHREVPTRAMRRRLPALGVPRTGVPLLLQLLSLLPLLLNLFTWWPSVAAPTSVGVATVAWPKPLLVPILFVICHFPANIEIIPLRYRT